MNHLFIYKKYVLYGSHNDISTKAVEVQNWNHGSIHHDHHYQRSREGKKQIIFIFIFSSWEKTVECYATSTKHMTTMCTSFIL